MIRKPNNGLRVTFAILIIVVGTVSWFASSVVAHAQSKTDGAIIDCSPGAPPSVCDITATPDGHYPPLAPMHDDLTDLSQVSSYTVGADKTPSIWFDTSNPPVFNDSSRLVRKKGVTEAWFDYTLSIPPYAGQIEYWEQDDQVKAADQTLEVDASDDGTHWSVIHYGANQLTPNNAGWDVEYISFQLPRDVRWLRVGWPAKDRPLDFYKSQISYVQVDA